MLDNSANNIICIFGLGQSGLSAARYLQKMNQPFFVVDSRVNPPGKEQIKSLSCCQSYYFGFIPSTKLNLASMIIVSPGVSPKLAELVLAKKMGVEVIGDIELFVRNTNKKIIAITGSNGKSTVTDLTCKLLVAAGLNAKIGGNFGIPVLDYLPDDDADIYVLELSSFQLDTLSSLKADVAIVLNITEDHMDRYVSFSDYIMSKLSIFNNAKKIIANADDQSTFSQIKQSFELFSLENDSAKYHLKTDLNNKLLVCDGKTILNINQLKLTGKHNWANVLVTLAILTELNLELTESVINCLKAYQGLNHRFQLVKRNNQIDWINDSKATNVGATQAALDGIDKSYYSSVVLIAGGVAKGADLSPLKVSLNEKVNLLVLIGQDAKLLARLMPTEKIIMATDMRNAVNSANQFIQRSLVQQSISGSNKNNYLVLLSPACASLDMYQNFEHRGQAFIDAVKECA